MLLFGPLVPLFRTGPVHFQCRALFGINGLDWLPVCFYECSAIRTETEHVRNVPFVPLVGMALHLASLCSTFLVFRSVPHYRPVGSRSVPLTRSIPCFVLPTGQKNRWSVGRCLNVRVRVWRVWHYIIPTRVLNSSVFLPGLPFPPKISHFLPSSIRFAPVHLLEDGL